MKRLTSMPPMQVAILAGISSTGVLGAILITWLRLPYRPAFAFWIAVIVGYAVMWTMERRLTKGISQGRWSEAELEPLRRRLEHPAWGWIQIALLLFYMTPLLSRSSKGASLFSLGALASLDLTRLRFALKRNHTQSDLMDLNSVAPIYSAHWGNRQIEAAHGQSMKP